MRLLLYSVLRVVLLVAALVLLHALGLRSWLLWFVAIIVAALLSYVLLPRMRDAAALQIAGAVRRRPRQDRSERRDEDADYEDAILDSAPHGAPGDSNPAADHEGVSGNATDSVTGPGAPAPTGQSSREDDGRTRR